MKHPIINISGLKTNYDEIGKLMINLPFFVNIPYCIL